MIRHIKTKHSRRAFFWLGGGLFFFFLCLPLPGCPQGLPPFENSLEKHSDGGISSERFSSESTREPHRPDVTDEKNKKEASGEKTSEEILEKSLREERPDRPAEKIAEERFFERAPKDEVSIEVSLEKKSEASPERVAELPGDGPVTTGVIGLPCKTDSDCGGAPYHCIAEGSSPRFPFPFPTGKGPIGGYCTFFCVIGGSPDCPKGSLCYVPGAAAGACLKECTQTTDCRSKEGYTCETAVFPKGKSCFPPQCKLGQPGGSYVMTLGPYSRIGGCTGQPPVPSGTTLNFQVTIQGTNITVEFGTKPGSPLGVTWPLQGMINASSVEVSRPNGCKTSCDGLLKGHFSNPCTFDGWLEIKHGTCSFRYDFTSLHR